MINEDRKFAVLIDADNVSSKYVKSIMDEVGRYGTPTIKRIYGDWTKSQNVKWKAVLLQNSILPVQQYNYTTGKNSSDAALIIDAMDILYSRAVTGFCIVSSDSDFTRLVARIREQGYFVIGMGEKKTSEPFIKACDKFTFLEVIAPEETEVENEDSPKEKESTNIQSKERLKKEIKQIIGELSDDDGFVFLGELGSTLTKRHPSFDTRNYGFKKLTPLLESLGGFIIRSDATADPNVKHISIKVKGRNNSKHSSRSKS